jgi:ribosome-associated toxin RatA of RatAB toxin-antitoxin module
MPYLRDQKKLRYPVDKVFDTALDLEKYPRILPYVKFVSIMYKSEDRMTGLLTMGLSFIAFTYRCDIHYKKNQLIEVASNEPLFRRFASRCTFEKANENHTIITYELDAQFVNPILEFLAAAAMPYQARATLRAFERYLSKI